MKYSRSCSLVAIASLFLRHVTCAILHPQEILSPAQHHASNEKVLEKHFSFDISWHDEDRLRVEEALALDGEFTHKNVKGIIALVKGDTKQAHAAEVLVKAVSRDQATLDCLDLTSDKTSLNLTTKSDCASLSLDLRIDTIIAIRPGTLQFGRPGTHIQSTFLDITVWRDLYFETYSMGLYSQSGSISCQEISSFTAHAITIGTDFGSITGNWSLPGSITFGTIAGKIDIDLPPKRWSSGPSSQGALTAASKTGSIDIRMPFEEDKLSLRNLTTHVSTDMGAVNVQLVHGALTHIESVTGHVNATLLPYWAFYQWEGVQLNHITTVCEVCDMHVDVLTPPPPDSYYGIPPLLFARSKHEIETGRMVLTYPKEWAGIAEWKVGLGVANVTGDDLEVIDEGRLSGKVQRRPLGSRLFAGVKVGVLDLTMKG